MKKKSYRLLALTLCLLANTGFSQSITLLSPTSGSVSVKLADDYTSDELSMEWDMDQLRDIPFENGFLQPSINSGIWTAVAEQAGAGAGLYLLNNNIPNPFAFNPTGVSDFIPYGSLNPVNADKYKKLSIRISMNQTDRGGMYVKWSKDKDVTASDNAPQVGSVGLPDSQPTYTSGLSPTQVKNPTGFRIYDIDLTGAYNSSEYVSWLSYAPIAPAGNPWSGNSVQAILMFPSTELRSGYPVNIDWARLYDPNDGQTLNVQWNTSGMPGDATYYSVSLMIDNNSTGYDGDEFAAGIKNDGSFSFNTGALPTGTWYVYLRLIKHENSGFTVVDQTAYSSAIIVDAPPAFEFTSPTFATGADYATTELNNPWDMNSAADVASTKDILSINYSGGVMSGVALAHGSNPVKDPWIFMNLRKGNGELVPIDTAKYKYLTYRFGSETYQYNDLFERFVNGWVVKLTWWKDDFFNDGTYSHNLHVYEGTRDYTVDLSNRAIINPRYNWDEGWTEVGEVKNFRFDPLENFANAAFNLDQILLCAENEPTAGRFNISWIATDPDSANITVRLFAGVDQGLGYQENPTPIAVINQTPGQNSFDWETLPLSSGEYYIRAEFSDGSHTNDHITAVPIVVVGLPPVSTTSLDPTVFDRSSGDWHILYAHGGADIMNWGWPNVDPIAGDYNGDGTNDLAIFDQSTGRWFIREVSGAVIAWEEFWGWPGVKPVPGDYDGDGVDDLAIFDQNTGRWFIRKVSGQILLWEEFWGWPGVEPVSGDFNNDGIHDLAIFDQNTGRWFIREVSGDILSWEEYWGWPGVRPVSGDYNADGRDDLAIFDQNTGRWFIKEMQGSVLLWEQWWGFAGCTPVTGDYDNDGESDRVVYFEPAGTWYFNLSSDGTSATSPWKGPGFIPVTGNYGDE